MNKTIVISLAFASIAPFTAPWVAADEPIAVARPTTAIPMATPAAAAQSANPKVKIQPLTVTVQLSGEGTKFTGTLSGLDQWPMKTSFGETNVPLSAVAGIKFAEEGHPSTTIILHNGDSVTGALDVNYVQIETSWGKAEIGSGHITSMLFSPGLIWTTEPGLNGNRWKLVADKETRPTARPTTNSAVSPFPPTAPAATAVAAPTPTATPRPATSSPPTFAPPGFIQPGIAPAGFAQPGLRPTASGS